MWCVVFVQRRRTSVTVTQMSTGYGTTASTAPSGETRVNGTAAVMRRRTSAALLPHPPPASCCRPSTPTTPPPLVLVHRAPLPYLCKWRHLVITFVKWHVNDYVWLIIFKLYFIAIYQLQSCAMQERHSLNFIAEWKVLIIFNSRRYFDKLRLDTRHKHKQSNNVQTFNNSNCIEWVIWRQQ